MPTQYDRDDHQTDSRGSDREISLGTGTVLAIFLALALVCSLFFGLGYSMGRKAAPATAAAAATHTTEARDPAPQRPPAQVAEPIEENSRASAGPDSTARKPSARSEIHPAKPSAPEPTTEPAAVPSGSQSFVQVAAVSRKEDADLLLAALKRRGYSGVLRQLPQDALLHIQVGPFPTRKDAEAMRQRLITDGYNPIIK